MELIDWKVLDLPVRYPYAVISDVHLHNWSAFSYINKDGVNNRLQHILDGIQYAANKLIEAGGRFLVITGDLFHTRGSIKPSVFNAAFDLFQRLSASGLTIIALAGNHDLEGKNSERLGNALTALSAIENFHVIDTPTITTRDFTSDPQFALIPWFDSPAVTETHIKTISAAYKEATVFCHVGLSDVLPGHVGETLNIKELERYDVSRIFSGHFHNHVSFNSRIYSVGALTHQTWGDTASKAGFLIVRQDSVEHFETKAPKFIDVSGKYLKKAIRGNYFRIKGVELNEYEAAELTKHLTDYGALGVLDQSSRPSIISKTYEHEMKPDLGMNHMLEAYCKNTFGDNWERILNECLKLKS